MTFLLRSCYQCVNVGQLRFTKRARLTTLSVSITLQSPYPVDNPFLYGAPIPSNKARSSNHDGRQPSNM